MNKESEIDATIRKNIGIIMERKGVTYRELEKLTGLDAATLHKYIRPTTGKTGQRRMTAARYFLIADALNADVKTLAGREN